MTNPYLKDMRRLDMTLLSLLKEIDYKNHMLIEMEHKNKEASTSTSKFVVSLKEKIDSRERSWLEMKHKYSESSIRVGRPMNERAKIHERYRRELRQLKTINTNMIHDMESLKEDHRQLTKELEESNALNDLQQKIFLEEIETLKRELHDANPGELQQLKTINTNMIHDMESLKEEHRQLTKELEESNALNDLQQKIFLDEIETLKRELQDANPGELQQLKTINTNMIQDMESLKEEHRQLTKELEESNALNDLQQKIFLEEIETLKRELHDANPGELQQLKTINTNMIHDMESLKEEHRQLTKELEESNALNDLQQKIFLDEIETLKRELQDANPGELQQLKTINTNMIQDMESLKEEHRQLTKELEESNALNDLQQKIFLKEIETLKGELQDANPGESGRNLTTHQLHTLREQLKDKMEYLETVDCINSSLIVSESRYKEELLDARAEIINHLQDMSSGRSHLGIKRMGELDPTPFQEACRLKYSNEDWQMISAQLCSSWEESLKNPNWHPFKKIEINSVLQEIVDENDEKLKGLRSEYGEMVYKAVENALMELENYNSSGRYAVSEIWNWKEGRRASLKEAIQYITKQLKSMKRKRKREQ